MRRISTLVLAGALVLFAAIPAAGNVPSGGNCSIPDWVPVVGTQLGVPHGQTGPGVPTPGTGQSITIVIRDFTNGPIQFCPVYIVFEDCSDIRLCGAPIVGAGDVYCDPTQFVGAVTNAFGEVTLTVVGGGTHSGLDPIPVPDPSPVGPNCVRIYADNTLLGTATAYVLNQNGAVGGIQHDGVDMALSTADVLEYIGFGVYHARSSYARDPGYQLSGLDLAAHKTLLLESFVGVGSATGCHDGSSYQLYCP